MKLVRRSKKRAILVNFLLTYIILWTLYRSTKTIKQYVPYRGLLLV